MFSTVINVPINRMHITIQNQNIIEMSRFCMKKTRVINDLLITHEPEVERNYSPQGLDTQKIKLK